MEILDVYSAYSVLNDGLIVKDLFNTSFKLKNKIIYARNENASFKLNKEDFIKLYSDSKFVILDDDSEIDTKKDEEYYSFKHK